MKNKHMGMTRRDLLKSAAALAAPSIVPASVLGREGRAAPSERIVMGGIGIGQRGIHNLRVSLRWGDVQVVAVSDPRQENREQAKEAVDKQYGNKDCQAHIDFREMLARDDMDAVMIATGDRWHAIASILAMKAGKDVYCEKPGSMSIAEGRALADVERRYGRVYQAGTQRRSHEPFVFVIQLARTGRLGKVHTLGAYASAGLPLHRLLPPEPEPPRDALDWDLFLGPAPWRPYNRGYLNWGGHYDLSAGGAGTGSHTFDMCQFANDSEHTGPVEYGLPDRETGGALVARYANGVKMVGGIGRSFPVSFGIRIEGSEGWAECSDDQAPTFHPKSLGGERERIIRDFETQSGRPLDHWRNFLDCVKSRRPAAAHAEEAHRALTICHIANICVQLRRSLKWDPVKEEFVGDEEANRMRSRPMRAPWQV